MFDALVGANASQSHGPPKPSVSVTVTLAPGATVVALTVSVGGGAIVKARAADVPPPGVGENTVTCAVPVAAISAAVIRRSAASC